MRIIAGKYKGLKFPAFHSPEIRPTTDKSKEAIFTYLENLYDLENAQCLDLFAGSGTVSIEFLSRGVNSLTSLDKGKPSIEYLKKLKKQLNNPKEWNIIHNDVFKILKQDSIDQYSIIFADPPYNMSSIHSFVKQIIEHMNPSCVFIMEHKSEMRFSSPYLRETKTYGKSSFSIFNKES